jgi:hypothetical protein
MCTIQLDTTLADLYRDHGIDGDFIVTMYCVFGYMDLHPAFPRELIFPEDEEPVPYSDDEQEKARLRRVILGLKPLRRAYGIGNMDVLFFCPDAKIEGMDRALAQLPLHQQHRPRFVDLEGGDVFDQLREATKQKKLLYWRPQGWMNDHDCLIDPREAYEINSKKFLVTSGMRTPPSKIISLQAQEPGAPFSPFVTTPLPFAVKLMRAGCGFGTFLVTSETRRAHMLHAMRKVRARGVPEVLISQYINVAQDLSVHFVVGAPGSSSSRDNPLIVGITMQTLTPDGIWVGGHIDYSAQEFLRDLLWDTVRDTTQRLPASFVGWAGIDIVVDKFGSQFVVDLNARFTGSLPICLLSGHFWKRENLPMAQFGAFQYYGTSMDVIYDRLHKLLESGQAIVTAIACIDENENMSDIIWGGKDQADLVRVEALIRKLLV